MHQCNHCHEYKGIQAFHNSQDEVICQDCYDEQQQFDEEIRRALIIQQREEMKKRLQELDKEELPF